jgi:signal transduction histidine kinase
VRELLVNVVKHARARTAVISLQREGGDLRVEVADDGTGFDPSRHPTPTRTNHEFGLFSIRERMGSIGGSCQIRSVPGRGTSVILVAPCLGRPGNPERSTGNEYANPPG